MMRSQIFCVWFCAIVVSSYALPMSLDEDYVSELTPNIPDPNHNHTALMDELFVLSRSHLERNHPHLIETKAKREISNAGGRKERQAPPLLQNDRLPDMRILESLIDYNPSMNETASSFTPLAVERKRRASKGGKKEISSEEVEDDAPVSLTEIGQAETTETSSVNNENSTLSLESSAEPQSEPEPSEITGGNTSLPENIAESEAESDAKVQPENGTPAEPIKVVAGFRDMGINFGGGENPLDDEVFLVERIRRETADEHFCPKDEEETKARNKKRTEKAKGE